MPIDISHLNIPQLKELQTKIASTIISKQTEGKAALIKQLEEMAAAEGYSLSELASSKSSSSKTGKSRSSVAIKYRDPNESSNTWTGRGRAPKWLVEFEGKGGKREEITVA